MALRDEIFIINGIESIIWFGGISFYRICKFIIIEHNMIH